MSENLTIDFIQEYIKSNFKGLVYKFTYKEHSFFYNLDRVLKNGVYFCTIKENDGINDKASNLNREGVFCLSCSLCDQDYQNLFGQKPKKALKGKVDSLNYDFSMLDLIMPHSIYAYMGYIYINNLSRKNLKFSKIILSFHIKKL
ncbi:DUF6194 family protein [Campylobacter lari]|uniref:DUF6194 family protein n=1 Tax=Campylobacter lari TaxID=201 RepID=UPI002149D257|nr:DUF6194 family protein [Campylobacter lari]MCR2082897.1 DUF6194 family protein [Campylobacter lari subsp. concheus]MCR2084256.1 DUF6194 family protein [Campylobacter lari subsp. concheus]